MKKLFIALGLFLTIGLTSYVGVNNDLPIQARAVAPQDESSEVVEKIYNFENGTLKAVITLKNETDCHLLWQEFSIENLWETKYDLDAKYAIVDNQLIVRMDSENSYIQFGILENNNLEWHGEGKLDKPTQTKSYHHIKNENERIDLYLLNDTEYKMVIKEIELNLEITGTYNYIVHEEKYDTIELLNCIVGGNDVTKDIVQEFNGNLKFDLYKNGELMPNGYPLEPEWVVKEYDIIYENIPCVIKLISKHTLQMIELGDDLVIEKYYVLINNIIATEDGELFRIDNTNGTASIYIEEIKKQPSIMASDFYAILTTPVVVAGVSLGTVGGIIAFIISRTSFGKKRLKKQDKIIDDNKENVNHKLNDYGLNDLRQDKQIADLINKVNVIIDNSRNVNVRKLKEGSTNDKETEKRIETSTN